VWQTGGFKFGSEKKPNHLIVNNLTQLRLFDLLVIEHEYLPGVMHGHLLTLSI